MWTIYIGRNNSLLKINNLHSKNKKIKCLNDANQDAPLIFDNAVQTLEKAGNMTGGELVVLCSCTKYK